MNTNKTSSHSRVIFASSDSAGTEAKSIAPAWHTFILIAIVLFLGFSQLPGPHPASPPPAVPFYLSAIVFESLLFAYVCWGIRLKGNSLAVLLSRGQQAMRGRDALTGIAIWAVWYLIESSIAFGLEAVGLTNAGAPGTTFPHGVLEIGLWIALAAITGWSEEIAFRGYLLKQFSAWTGSTTIGVVLQATLFGMGHTYLGLKQVLLITVSGAILGVFAVRLRNLRPLMVTHAWADIFGGLIVHGLPYG